MPLHLEFENSIHCREKIEHNLPSPNHSSILLKIIIKIINQVGIKLVLSSYKLTYKLLEYSSRNMSPLIAENLKFYLLISKFKKYTKQMHLEMIIEINE